MGILSRNTNFLEAKTISSSIIVYIVTDEQTVGVGDNVAAAHPRYIVILQVYLSSIFHSGTIRCTVTIS